MAYIDVAAALQDLANPRALKQADRILRIRQAAALLTGNPKMTNISVIFLTGLSNALVNEVRAATGTRRHQPRVRLGGFVPPHQVANGHTTHM